MNEQDKKIECVLLKSQKQIFLLPLVALVELVTYTHASEFSQGKPMSHFMWRGINLPLVNFMLAPLSYDALDHPKVAIIRTFFKAPSPLCYVAVLCEGRPSKIEVEEKAIAWEKEEERQARLLKEKEGQLVRLLDLQAFSSEVEKMFEAN